MVMLLAACYACHACRQDLKMHSLSSQTYRMRNKALLEQSGKAQGTNTRSIEILHNAIQSNTTRLIITSL